MRQDGSTVGQPCFPQDLDYSGSDSVIFPHPPAVPEEV